ncbi:MAG: hypothetical protein PHZ19_07655 [Candidatus Thermoplasmatota archaeon]|jgi:hypothetical protein|nr:hypothetical protein [Candidatus Thermoplasmatota archaeon]
MIRSIYDRMLEPNYLFALEWRDAVDRPGSSGYIFGRTIRVQHKFWKPYAVIDGSGTAVDIAATSAQAELRVRDSRNAENDILYLDEEVKGGYPWFLHGAIGIKPEPVRAYLRFPEGRDIPGKFPNVDPIRPSQGDSLGYLDAFNSPYNNPSTMFEMVIPPKQHLGIEYYNTDSLAHQPVLNLAFALYWVQFFDPADPKQKTIVRKIASREVPAAYLSVGFGDTPMEMGSPLQKSWNVKPITLMEAMQ